MYSIVFFDMDGTIADSSEGIIKSIVFSLKKFGIVPENVKELKKFIGPPLKDSFVNFYGFSELQAFTAVDYYRQHYEKEGIYQTKLYNGITDVIKSLKERGIKVAIASSKPVYFIEKILDNFGIRDLFDYIGGSEMDGSRSEKSEVIANTMAELNITDASEVIMVGDRYFDIDGAKKCGIDTVGVLYGFGSIEELQEHSASAIVGTVKDLGEYLNNVTAAREISA